MPRKKSKWVIRVTYPNGQNAYLRHGGVVGEGRLAQFATKKLAEINVEMISPGLDDGCVVTVIQIDPRF